MEISRKAQSFSWTFVNKVQRQRPFDRFNASKSLRHDGNEISRWDSGPLAIGKCGENPINGRGFVALLIRCNFVVAPTSFDFTFGNTNEVRFYDYCYCDSSDVWWERGRGLEMDRVEVGEEGWLHSTLL
jgi:hypothetical protein